MEASGVLCVLGGKCGGDWGLSREVLVLRWNHGMRWVNRARIWSPAGIPQVKENIVASISVTDQKIRVKNGSCHMVSAEMQKKYCLVLQC